jgi:hypothetical protein
VQSMRRRCTAVLNAAGGHTRYWLLLLILTPPLFRGTLFHFCKSHVYGTCSVYVSAVESYVIYTLSLLKINAVDSERTFIFLLSLSYTVHYHSETSYPGAFGDSLLFHSMLQWQGCTTGMLRVAKIIPWSTFHGTSKELTTLWNLRGRWHI